MPTQKHPKEVFFAYFPAEAVDYCFSLWQQYKFHFKITKKRSTKLGDYRFYPISKKHIITVNGDLNSFAFLITYLHEVAHLITQVKFGIRNIEPHGDEWKKEFVILSKPLLNEKVFPAILLDALINYFKNPKASSCADPHLLKALQFFDENPQGIFLFQVPLGHQFVLNKRKFVPQKIQRTRILCVEIPSGKRYLISKMALVTPLHVQP